MTNTVTKIYKNWTEYDIYSMNGDVNTATSSTEWVVKLGSDTTQTVAANSPSSTAWKTYPVQLNSSNQAVVNVPRTDTTLVSSVNTRVWDVEVSEFTPWAWTTWQVLTKTENGYWWANGQGISKSSITVTLLANSWSNNEQTVSATWVTTTNDVIIAPAPDSYSAYASNSIFCLEQGSGSLKFICREVPSGDVNVNVLILS